MAIKFSWVVESVDETSGTMVVAYTKEGGGSTSLNIPMPRGEMTIEQQAAAYAPIITWTIEQEAIVPVEIGRTGTGTLEEVDL